MLFGRQLRDALPAMPAGYHDPAATSYFERYGKPSTIWDSIKKQRELTHAKKHLATAERYNADKRVLPPLSVGDCVSIQNRSGPHPLRWDRTGKIVERLENRQYLVKSDGSGRILLRTRTHLRLINPTTRNQAQGLDAPLPENKPLLIPGSLQDGTKVIDPVDTAAPDHSIPPDIVDPSPSDSMGDNNNQVENHTPSATETVTPPPLRRSTRQCRAPDRLSPSMHGKSYT